MFNLLFFSYFSCKQRFKNTKPLFFLQFKNNQEQAFINHKLIKFPFILPVIRKSHFFLAHPFLKMKPTPFRLFLNCLKPNTYCFYNSGVEC